MSMLAALLAANWQAVLGLAGALVGAASLYFKGRSDAARKSENQDLRNANHIRKAGDAARSGVDTSPERLRDDDGWRRD